MRFLLLLAFIVGLVGNSHADELDLGFNADALRVVYAHPFEGSEAAIDGGWLHHQDKGNVYHAGLYLTGLASQGANPVRAGIGIRAVYMDPDDFREDGWAAPVGGFLRYTLPRLNRISFTAHAYYAPEVLSVGDAEKYEDYSIRVGYALMPRADVYVGARYVKGEFDNNKDRLFDNGMHVGLNLRF